MKEFWNQRFDIDGYVYGTSPSHFFEEKLWDQKFGRLLLPGEGEGRNAVYAAKKGWFVHAFDFSNIAAAKAIALSRHEKVRFEYQISEVSNFETAADYYHLVGITFLHLPPNARKRFHYQMVKCLVPGGKLIAEYFSKKQLSLSTGGPKNPEMLYDIDELTGDFESLNIVEIHENLIDQQSGFAHKGEAWVIRLVCEKP
ncbi:MAG: class I SAM-dependent methyltransferase [Bacteroidota bacterium]